MKATLARRLALLESQRGNAARRMHIITATMSDLVAAGSVAIRDGFLCITGKPLGTKGRD